MTARKKGRRNWTLGLAPVIILGLVLYFQYLQPNWKYEVRGIDVSHYQGEIDWVRVAEDGIQFAFIKATEGQSLVDEKFSTNWKEAREAGVLCGAYHFFRPSVDPKLQAKNFLGQVEFESGDLPPVLDLEVTDKRSAREIRECALVWMQEVEKATELRPILYTMPSFADSYLQQKFVDYPLWMVDLGWGEPRLPKGWKQWTFWQHSFEGRVAGISGDVDLDYYYGSPEALRALTKP